MGISSTVRTSTTTKVAVGASTTVILATNPNRKGAVFTNDSDEDIYLAFGNSAVMNEGLLLGQDYPPFKIDGACLFTGAVNGICTSGSKNLTVTEFV